MSSGQIKPAACNCKLETVKQQCFTALWQTQAATHTVSGCWYFTCVTVANLQWLYCTMSCTMALLKAADVTDHGLPYL